MIFLTIVYKRHILFLYSYEVMKELTEKFSRAADTIRSLVSLSIVVQTLYL